MGYSLANFFSTNECVESVLPRCTANDYQSIFILKNAAEHFFTEAGISMAEETNGTKKPLGFPGDLIWRINLQLMGKL